MPRVSDNNIATSLNQSVNRAKSSMEKLQLKGAHLKKVISPSDDPIGSTEALAISSSNNDNKQYLRNANFAMIQLNIMEKSLEQLTDLMVDAKEMAIAQSSDIYNPKVRENISNKIIQIRNEALTIANKRLGQKFIFSGHKILNKPFTIQGEYLGDKGKIHVEIAKDFFVPINLNGHEIFFESNDTPHKIEDPIANLKNVHDEISTENDQEDKKNETPLKISTKNKENFHSNSNIFGQLNSFATALETNDTDAIQGLLEKFDNTISRLITLRTRVGSTAETIANTQNLVEDEVLSNTERKSFLIDADVAKIFSDISKQQGVLHTTYKAGSAIVQKSLVDFLR